MVTKNRCDIWLHLHFVIVPLYVQLVKWIENILDQNFMLSKNTAGSALLQL